MEIGKTAQKWLFIILFIVIVLGVYGAIAPTLTAATTNLTGQGGLDANNNTRTNGLASGIASVFTILVPLLVLAGMLIFIVAITIKYKNEK